MCITLFLLLLVLRLSNMTYAFNQLIKNNAKSPITLSVYAGRSHGDVQKKRNLVFVFEKFTEIRTRVECVKCEMKSSGARFEAKISGGAQRGNLRFIDLCVQYGWTNPKLDDILTDKLMGQRSW